MFCNDYTVEVGVVKEELFFICSECFVDFSSEVIAVYGVFKNFFTNNNAKSILRLIVRFVPGDEKFTSRPKSFSKNVFNLSTWKPLFAGEHEKALLDYLLCFATVSCLRPLLRLAARTRRPPGLLMRFRKPCVFARFLFFSFPSMCSFLAVFKML